MKTHRETYDLGQQIIHWFLAQLASEIVQVNQWLISHITLDHKPWFVKAIAAIPKWIFLVHWEGDRNISARFWFLSRELVILMIFVTYIFLKPGNLGIQFPVALPLAILVGRLVGALKSTHIKVAKFEKHCSSWIVTRNFRMFKHHVLTLSCRSCNSNTFCSTGLWKLLLTKIKRLKCFSIKGRSIIIS